MTHFESFVFVASRSVPLVQGLAKVKDKYVIRPQALRTKRHLEKVEDEEDVPVLSWIPAPSIGNYL